MIERFLGWSAVRAAIGFIAVTPWLVPIAAAQVAGGDTASGPSRQIAQTTESADLKRATDGGTQTFEDKSQPPQPPQSSQPEAKSDPFSKYGAPDNSDPELLVLRLMVGNDIVLSSELLAYQRGGRLSIALGEFVNLIEYPIAVSPEAGTASGWFLSQDRKFRLDMASGKVEVDGRTLKIPPAPLVEIVDDDIYVDTRVLGDWFPIGFDPSIGTLTLHLKPTTPLPIQARVERDKRRQSAQRFQAESTDIPIEKFEKDWWSVPALDFNYQFRANGGPDTKSGVRNDYLVLGEGDLGKMTANVFLSGTDNEIFSVRGTLTKEDPEGGMLGPFHATSVVLGDIGAPKTPFVRARGQDRGIRIKNSEIFSNLLFDTTSFGGNLPRGWDVELYQNGILIDAADINDDGRYDFDDVPLFFGSNDFEVVSYGPQGQRKVRKSTLYFDPSAIKKGKTEYDIVVSEKGRSLISPLNTLSQVDQGSFHFVSQISRGVSRNVSFRGSFSSEEFSGKRFNHFNLGTAFTGFGFFGRTDWTNDLSGGNAARLILQRKVGPLNLRFSRIQYWNFLTDPDLGLATDQKHETEIGFITTSRPYKFLPSITANVEYRKSVREDSSRQVAQARLSTRISETLLTNNLTRIVTKGTGRTRTDTDGRFQATLNLDKLIIRAFVGYELEPLKEVTSLGFASIWRFNRNLSMNLGMDLSLAGTNFALWNASLSWDAGFAILTPSLIYDSEDNYTAVVIAKFGLSHEPRNNRVVATSNRRRGTGAVSARVFLDNNANQIFDEGDEVLENVKVKASTRGRKRRAVTDQSGVGLITNIPGGGATIIEVDEETIEDPFWLPKDKTQLVVGRPGTTQLVDFPVVNTGEVDGVVRLDDGEGNERNMGGVQVELTNKDGTVVDTARTAFDGFYLFTLVKPGSYTVQIPKTGKRQREFLVGPSATLKISGAGEIISNVDFLVRTKSMLALKHELELRHQLDEERALVEASLERVPVVLPRRSDPDAQAVARPKAPAVARPGVLDKKASRTGMHLASYRSRDAAEAGWKEILTRDGDIFDGFDHAVSKVDLGADRGVYFRLKAVTDQGPDAARAICAQLQQRNQYCVVSAVSN